MSLNAELINELHNGDNGRRPVPGDEIGVHAEISKEHCRGRVVDEELHDFLFEDETKTKKNQKFDNVCDLWKP